jgi:phosphoribosylformimino-5-aminoimidazole carboxamide ribotide isomerase
MVQEAVLMLQIIPVIDIREGRVVHARGGERHAYPPLVSQLTKSVDVAEVVADLLAFYPFPQLYIADLDAIETGQIHTSLYQTLASQFPQLQIWLDCGIHDEEQLTPFKVLTTIYPVLGSETLDDLSLLSNQAWRQRLILSLDRRKQQFLGQPELLSNSELWPQNVIVMSLDHVGSHSGPALEWFQQLQSERADVNWFIAGGIRNEQDLKQVEQFGGAGVLVASALHTGQIVRQTISRFMEQEYRPS